MQLNINNMTGLHRRSGSFEFSENELVSSRSQSLKGWLKDLTRYISNIPAIDQFETLMEDQEQSESIAAIPFVRLILTEENRCLELMKNIRCFLLERLK